MQKAEDKYAKLLETLNMNGGETLKTANRESNVMVDNNNQVYDVTADGWNYSNKWSPSYDRDEGQFNHVGQIPKVIGVEFDDDEDEEKFNSLWRMLWTEAYASLGSNMTQEIALSDNVWDQISTDKMAKASYYLEKYYGNKGYDKQWAEDWLNREIISHGDYSYPDEQRTSINPITGEEEASYWMPHLKAYVNKDLYRQYVEEHRQADKQLLYGDHAALNIKPRDLPEGSAGSELEENDPRLQLFQPVEGS